MGWFSDLFRVPEVRASHRGLSMRSARAATSAAVRSHEAGVSDRLVNGWTSTPVPADDIVRRDQRILVARSREQAINNAFARKYLKMVRTNCVGDTGIMLQARARDIGGTLDERANDAIEAAFRDWSRKQNCDVAGRLSFRQVQAACVTSAARDGEFFVRKIMGSKAGKYGLQLQIIDAQRCPCDFDRELANGSFIRHGIEFDRYGKALAYLFSVTDESEADYYYGGRSYTRVPADEIIHGFDPELTGQKRGLPWMATALTRLKHLGDYEKASLINAKIGASKMGFFEWQEGYGPEADEDEEVVMDVEPGVFRELPAGVQFKEYSPQFPTGEYAQFHKSMLRAIASGLGVSYNVIANDVSEVNFSSIRQSLLEERDHWKDVQQWLIESLCTPVYEAWLPRALLLGLVTINGAPLPAAKVDKYLEHSWQPRRWQWVDPRADSEAAVNAMNNMLASPSSLIREQGRDPDSVWREIGADIKAMKAAGIPDDLILATVKAVVSKAQPKPAGGGGANGGQAQDQ